MVEAGARKHPRTSCSRRWSWPTARSGASAQAQIELASKAGKPKWVDGAVTEALRSRHAAALQAAVAEGGLGRASRRPRRDGQGGASRDRPVGHRGRHAAQRQRVQFALQQLGRGSRRGCIRRRQGAVRRPDPRPDRCRAGLEGAEVGASARHCSTRLPEAFSCPSRPAPRRTSMATHRSTSPPGGRLGGGGQDLQGNGSYQDRGRQAAPRRPFGDRDPQGLIGGIGDAAHARLGALHPRPDAGADAVHPGHRQGGAAHRRSVARRRRSATSTTTTSRPSSVGETGFMRGPKRRDIGHGALAERALVPVHPGRRGVPLHDAARVGDHGDQRLLVDGVGVRLDARR